MQLSQAIMFMSDCDIYFAPTQVLSLTQALRAKEREVILEHEDNRWRVDLDKMEQKPVVQPFLQYKRRQVRYFTLDGHSS